MQENSYSATVAELTVPANNKASTDAPFFAVSPLKLVVMSVFTSGLYELYWFYKNWQAIKLRKKEDIYPFWRAFFAYFFCHALFNEVRECQEKVGKGKMPAGWLACGWIITYLMWRLPDPFWLISTASVVFLVPVQKVVNSINLVEAPDHAPNEKFSVANWITIAVGGSILALALPPINFLPVDF
jgi:hypothetical protein